MATAFRVAELRLIFTSEAEIFSYHPYSQNQVEMRVEFFAFDSRFVFCNLMASSLGCKMLQTVNEPCIPNI